MPGDNAHIKLAPSLLTADFARLGQQVAAAVDAGADYIHFDVMDGHFVPNLTMGALVLASLRSHISVPVDVHLMIESPERLLKDFADAGADILTVHVEATLHLHRTLDAIHELGRKTGVALNPSTPLVMIEEVLHQLDLVNIMTVNPGYGGQRFIPAVVPKIARMRRMLDESGSLAELLVDGGINPKTAPLAVGAGATVLVAGSAVFNQQATPEEAIQKIRRSLEGVSTTAESRKGAGR